MPNQATAESGLFSGTSVGAVRAVAAGAGDWSILVVREVSRILAEERGKRPEALARGIGELQSRELISKTDAEHLKEIINAFYKIVRKDDTTGESRDTIADRQAKINFDLSASPAAVAIASVVARNMSYAAEAPAPAPREAAAPGGAKGVARASITITPENTGAGAVVGAVVGAGVGGAVGGVVGAGVGALVGAAAGAAVGFSNE